MAILPVGIGPQEGGYQIERSLRFNSADSAYLSRTPASAGNRKTWTWSAWLKITAVGTRIFDSGTNSDNWTSIGTNGNGTLYTEHRVGDVTQSALVTTQVFRDPSAWYHIMVVWDTTQATSSNRIKIYVNGTQVTAFSTSNYGSQNTDTYINSTNAHYLGAFNTVSQYFNGYMAEVHFIDGSALDPTSFGEYNSDTGVWQPKAYTGSYGTNGFYLDFADNSSTTALGYDAAGSNDWTPNNFSVTAGAGNDSLVDTPTPYGTDTGVGAEVRGNYATLNPLNANKAPTNGNLDLAGTASGGYHNAPSTIAMTTGKWYWEVTCTAYSGDGTLIGVSTDAYNYLAAASGSNYIGSTSTSWSYYGNNGYKYNNLSGSSYGSTFTTNDVIGIALDLDNGAIYFSKNGTWQNSGVPTSGASKTGAAYTTGLTGSTYYAGVSVGNNNSIVTNFGQRPFAYAAPSGFKALCTQNLPEPTVVDGGEYFQAVPYQGNSSTQTISGVGFQPDFTWLKGRSYAGPHKLFDAVRGATKSLSSNLTDAEVTDSDALTAFTSDGFSLGADGDVNRSADGGSHISWNWKANGTGVSNTAGTITSTVSANTTAGFSIVTYTGTGANATVGHGLSAVGAPKMVIVKTRSNTENWAVWQTGLTSASYHLRLNGTNAQIADIGGGTTVWNGTAPTSTVFSIGSGYNETNGSGLTYVAYCFAPVAGYSAFGSYTGNGSSDGPFIFCGFRPRWIMCKTASGGTDDWLIIDTERTPYNQGNMNLAANLSNAESYFSGNNIDLLSNGFKLRNSGNPNGSGKTYIYAAFAETPFSLSLAR